MSDAQAIELRSFVPSDLNTNSGLRVRTVKELSVIDSFARLFRDLSTTVTPKLESGNDERQKEAALAEQPKQVPTAADQLETLKKSAALTDEEVAMLLGTTRQTLYNWRAGKKISARREQRLEKTLEAVQTIGAPDVKQTRRVLMHSDKGQVRIFDLLAEGSIDSAMSAISGKPFPHRQLLKGYSLATQMGLLEDRAPEPKPEIDRRFSKKL